MMDDDEPLSPEEAVRRLMEEPHEAWITLGELWKFMKRRKLGTKEDIRQALIAGKLVANGVPDGRGGYTHVQIRLDGIVNFLAGLLAAKARH